VRTFRVRMSSDTVCGEEEVSSSDSVCGEEEVPLHLQAQESHLLQCQKRPTTVSKETYYSVKRDLLQ